MTAPTSGIQEAAPSAAFLVPGQRWPYRYAWKNNPKRKKLFGRRCRIIVTGTMGSCLVQWAGGDHDVISRRALRKAQ